MFFHFKYCFFKKIIVIFTLYCLIFLGGKTLKRIVILALILILVLSLISCSPTTPPDKIVIKTFDALKSMDKETASNYIDYNKIFSNANISEGITEDTKYDVARILLKNLNYKILTTNTGFNTASVKAEITNVNMIPILSEYTFQNMNQMKSKTNSTNLLSANQILIDLLNRQDNKKATKTIDIQLENKDNTWKIKLTDDLLDALLGGAPTFINNINKAMMSYMSK